MGVALSTLCFLPFASGQVRGSSESTETLVEGHRELFTCGDEPLPSFGPNVVNPKSVVSFIALADGPYGTEDRYRLNKQLRDLDLSSDDGPSFMVHLGDIKTGGSRCDEAAFKDVANIFSNPANALNYDHRDWFWVVGDNEWNDCGNRREAWKLWTKYFGEENSYGFGTGPSLGVRVERQTDINRSENFAFFKNKVLFVGLHMVGGGTVGDESVRVAENFEFVKDKLIFYRDEIVAVAIFGHARSGGERRKDFALPFYQLLRDEFDELPALYIHGDGHDWCVNYVDSQNRNLVEVELEAVTGAPPVLVSVLEDPNTGKHIFDIDRRGGCDRRCPQIMENTWDTPDGPRGPLPAPRPTPTPVRVPTIPPAPSPRPEPLGVRFDLISADLGVVVETTDSDGLVKSVELYINDTFVRREGESPFEFGTANTKETDPILLNLPSGSHELRTKVVDRNGATSIASATISVLIDLCPDDPDKMNPGDCGCHAPEGSCTDDETTDGKVLPSDTVLVKPDSQGPIVAPITAYTWEDRADWPDFAYELPIYNTLNRNTDDYWNFLVDELLLSRVDVVMFHGRGCWDVNSGTRGTGDLCPRHLSKFVEAVDRAGARNVIRVGMWDDTATYNKAMQRLENRPPGTRLDLSNQDNWNYFWDHNLKIWFDTIPQGMWFLWENKPVIAFWNLRDRYFSNQEGNASKMLEWIISRFVDRYGMEPAFILQDDWFEQDSTIDSRHAFGMHGWLKPENDVASSICSYETYRGKEFGVVAPSFRDGGGSLPGCGNTCREVTRRAGDTLDDALLAGKNADFILLEGWTNMAESAGFYRSLDWSYPAQYINIVRRYADPQPETLRFQAEGADRFRDTTEENLGGEYADRALDVGKLGDNTGWFVGWTEPGEWLEYQEVELGCGTYRFTARVSTDSPQKKLRLDLGDLPSVELPNTGGYDNYWLIHLGEVQLREGTYDLRLEFESGGVNVDWFFLKKHSSECQPVA